MVGFLWDFLRRRAGSRRIRAHHCAGLRLYFVSLIGASLAKQGRVSPAFGAWLADLVFFARLCSCSGRPSAGLSRSSAIKLPWKRIPLPANVAVHEAQAGRRRDTGNAFERAQRGRRVFSANFPTLIDDYVLRDFFVYLGMIVSTFLVLLLVFHVIECVEESHPTTERRSAWSRTYVARLSSVAQDYLSQQFE